MDSIAIGVNNTTASAVDIAIGNSNVCSGSLSIALGNSNTVSAIAGVGIGYQANVKRFSQISFSGAATSSAIYKQESKLFLSQDTANATPVVLSISGTVDTDEVGIETNSLVRFKGTIVAVQHAGSSGTVGDSATFDFYGTIKNVAGTTALVDSVLWMDNTGTISTTPAQSSQDAAAAAWAVAITADNVNDVLQIEVTGEANKSIYWHCVLELNEIKYAV